MTKAKPRKFKPKIRRQRGIRTHLATVIVALCAAIGVIQFYRPDAARTREAGGVGLGLAIVRSGIEACGGTVRAENALPNGLCVVFRLPFAATGASGD